MFQGFPHSKISYFLILSVAAVFLISNSIAGQSIEYASTRYATRTISEPDIHQNEWATIYLDIGILPGDKFYIIEEMPPAGWSVVDPGEFNVDSQGRLKYVMLSSPYDRRFSYIIMSPAATGNYNFSGVFQIDGMATPQNIGGDNQINVALSNEICNNGIDDNMAGGIDEGCDDDDDDYCDINMPRVTSNICTGTSNCCNLGGNDCDDSNPFINPGSINPDLSPNVYCNCIGIPIAETCGDGIDQNCDGMDSQCCSITSALWNESVVDEGTTVGINVQGANCADGTQILLELWESDGSNGVDLMDTIDLGSTTLTNNRASSEWSTVWTRDSGDATSDPEYFFKAIIQINPAEFRVSDILRVNNDDEDSDGITDSFDCNDIDPSIGACSGCAGCSDPAGYQGSCVDVGQCPDIQCQGSCGYGSCLDEQLPSFNATTEAGICNIANDNGACSTSCENYACNYDYQTCGLDDDGDGIPNIDDKCPGTATNPPNGVNIYGCPMPIFSKFTPSLTTDFHNSDLLDLNDMTIGITGRGQVLFNGNVTLLTGSSGSYGHVDLDSNADIEQQRVDVDSLSLPMLDKPGLVTLYGLAIEKPVIKVDGAVCDDCVITNAGQYAASSTVQSNLQFSVPGFSEYTVSENVCGDGYCYSSVEDCVSCSSDCGVCPCVDQDKDGFNGTGSCDPQDPMFDCNDGDASINPGQTEIAYNGKDDDCDSATQDNDIDGDGMDALGFGGTDCNDNNAGTGECTGCASCSDLLGLSGVCIADDSKCSVLSCPSNTNCGYGTCDSGQRAVFETAHENSYCSISAEVGTCIPSSCENYYCMNDATCSTDHDGDGVPNDRDKCPNTPPEYSSNVNKNGCPKAKGRGGDDGSPKIPPGQARKNITGSTIGTYSISFGAASTGSPQEGGIISYEAAEGDGIIEFQSGSSDGQGACESQPIQPCPTAVWLNYPSCSWDVSQCSQSAAACVAGNERCLGNYVQVCDASTGSWVTDDICIHGCDPDTLECNLDAPVCNEEWVCEDWGKCEDGIRSRFCYDSNTCNTFGMKPREVESCGGFSLAQEPDGLTMLTLVIVIVLVALFLIATMKLR
jgi:hypothetical protein